MAPTQTQSALLQRSLYWVDTKIPEFLEIIHLKDPNGAITTVAFDMLLSICELGVGLNLKQRQRQNTDGFRCKLHLLTLRPINTL